jgi:hypothetical protein
VQLWDRERWGGAHQLNLVRPWTGEGLHLEAQTKGEGVMQHYMSSGAIGAAIFYMISGFNIHIENVNCL